MEFPKVPSLVDEPQLESNEYVWSILKVNLEDAEHEKSSTVGIID
jgi:hypothetical protein